MRRAVSFAATFAAAVLSVLGNGFVFSQACMSAEVKIPAEVRLKVKRLGKINAVSESVVRWINLADDLDLIPDSSGKSAILLGAKAGRYKIAAYTADKDGPSEPAYSTIIVEAEDEERSKPTPPPAPKPTSPEQAIVKIRFGNSGCTATIIGEPRPDGRVDVLSAAHCIASVGQAGTMTLKDGRSFRVVVAKVNRNADIAWLLSDPVQGSLPSAKLATEVPPVGTKVWHQGYGIDRPGNKETGTINSAIDNNGQIRFRLSVSSGDSGGGIFVIDTNELIGVVCCTNGMARVADVWGGCSITAAKMLQASEEQNVHPILIHPIEMLTD